VLVRLKILAFIGWVTACSHQRIEGAACDEQPNECIDAASLWNCASGEWVRVECANYCASIGQKRSGCLVSEDGDVCRCVPDEPGVPCTADDAPAPRCIGDQLIEACIEGHVITVPCGDLCSYYEAAWTAGCFYDSGTREESCVCVREGDACDGRVYPSCWSHEYLFHCAEDGLWRGDSCTDICAPTAAIGCSNDVSGVAECLCAD
jgi:hypothetical protein